MGWQCELIYRRLVAFTVLAASSILQLEGINFAPSPVSFGYHSQEASSPSQIPNSASAYAPTFVSFPKVISPTYRAAAPSIHPVIPTVMSPAPSAHLGIDHQWPGAVAPAVEGRPNAPIASGKPYTVLPSPSQSQPSPFDKVPITPRMSPNSGSLPHAIIYFHGSAPPPLTVNPPIGGRMRNGMPIASPPVEVYRDSSSTNISPTKGSNKNKPSSSPHGPLPFHSKPPPEISIPDGPAPSPTSSGQQRRATNGVVNHSAQMASPISPPSYLSGPMVTPAPEVFPKYNQMHHASPPHQHGSSFFLPHASTPALPSLAPEESHEWSSASHKTTPDSYPGASNYVPPIPVWVLPPPPPNTDCKSLVCDELLTNPPPGSPCVCVLPIQVGLRLSVTLYTFFPLVPKFAQEIAYEIYMNTSQVRVMGANVADELPENTIVLLDLVPARDKFDQTTAFSIFERFWNKDIATNTSLFGDYTVLFVLYPGLPPSPPGAPIDSNADGTSANNYNARMMKPLGVDLRKSEAKKKASGNLVAVIVLSSLVALLLCVGAAWYLLLKKRGQSHLGASNMPQIPPLFANSSGTKHVLLGNRFSSYSASFNSSVATYAGQAKIFTSNEVERATNRFDERRVIGEGGFGRVYEGTLEDGLRVAVKVLMRDDQQGGREFFAEIEMLSRLHHRNLVKLIGICIEEHMRCLVYELIPNGSLESHLHGLDKETAPLDWSARMKIALGAARGLAYLHEDSNPRVIHRDFKSSNILLEYDYTPKVSDFGLARAAVDEGNLHISTQIMGTFGYVAPEYAMTGHLLVKSDVYSYGVVLLELLTGRKPVNMLQPPGQENLVAWARPLLTNMDNLETIIDPALGKNVPLDSVAKVAAIASMCVQPEVSHRPFMGEVVQALNLVCHECDENKRAGTCSRDTAARISNGLGLEAERVLLESYLLSTSTRFDGDESSFQRHWSTGPLITSKKRKFWERLRSTSTGSMSEHGAALGFRTSTYFVDLWS